MNRMALPSWLLTPGTVLLRRHVGREGDPFCDPVKLVEGNPTYSVVRLPDGKECTVPTSRGGARHFHFGGPLEEPVLQQGELSMVCVGLSERDMKNFWGARQNFGGQCPPWHPPSSAPAYLRFDSVPSFSRRNRDPA